MNQISIHNQPYLHGIGCETDHVRESTHCIRILYDYFKFSLLFPFIFIFLPMSVGTEFQ